MLFLIDRDKKRRLDVLKFIYQAPHHTISFHELQQKMGLSTVTLMTTLDQILHDISDITTTTAIYEYRQGNQKWYSLPEDNQIIQVQLRQYYLQESIKFHIMKDLFLNDGGTLKGFSQKYFLSESKITREIKQINNMLEEHRLHIEGFKALRLVGNESSLRYFFVHLLFHTYQGQDWPFENMDPFLVKYYRDLFPNRLYQPIDVKGNLYASYIVAISLIRCQQSHFIGDSIPTEWLYHDPNDVDFMTKLSNFIDYLIEDPQYSGTPEQYQKEALFIYSFVFSQQTFSGGGATVPDFFNSPALEELYYMRDVDYILNSLANLFEKKLDDRTYRIWRYHLTVIHYRLLLFPEILVTLPAYWTVDFLTVIEKDLYYQLTYKRIYSDLVITHDELNEDHLDYLTRAYSVLTMPYVSDYFMKQPLNILFLTNNTDFHFLYKAFTSDFARIYFHIKAVEIGDPNTDVIISDTLVNATLLGLPDETPVIYYETNSYFDYLNHIQNKLFQIQLKKNGLNKEDVL